MKNDFAVWLDWSVNLPHWLTDEEVEEEVLYKVSHSLAWQNKSCKSFVELVLSELSSSHVEIMQSSIVRSKDLELSIIVLED